MKPKHQIIVAIIVWIIFISFAGIISYQAIQIEKLEERLDQVETRMKTVEEVFGQAQIIKQRINRVNSKANAPDIAYMILHLAYKYQVDYRQITAQAEVESAYRVDAVGRLGERGLLQVRPATFSEHGSGNINDWRDSLEAGVRYITWLNRHYGESILSYNAGPNHPRKHIVSRGYFVRVRRGIERLEVGL